MGTLVSRVGYFSDAAKFIARKHLHGYIVNPEPSFEKEGLEFFRSAIRQSRIYLEYGSGGSTLMASAFAKKIVSVESDAVFAKVVKKALPPSTADIQILTPNIGPTIEWGTPVFGRPTPARIKRWKKYPKVGWEALGVDIPDLILIDGRFRLACALESLMHIGPDTTLIVDDYVGRSSYNAIERFASLVTLHGIMAEFRIRSDFDPAECRKALEIAYSQIR